MPFVEPVVSDTVRGGRGAHADPARQAGDALNPLRLSLSSAFGFYLLSRVDIRTRAAQCHSARAILDGCSATQDHFGIWLTNGECTHFVDIDHSGWSIECRR